MKLRHIDWSHKWQHFYLVANPKWGQALGRRESVSHAAVKRIWDTEFTAYHWTPAAFRIMQEIVLA